MNSEKLIELLEELAGLPRETEWVEFKMNKGSVTNEDIGKYISALSNGACIKNQSFGYIVWGIEDKTHKLLGTNFKFAEAKEGAQDLGLATKLN
jgi:ATP-dependent DNA helicase RecG